MRGRRAQLSEDRPRSWGIRTGEPGPGLCGSHLRPGSHRRSHTLRPLQVSGSWSLLPCTETPRVVHAVRRTGHRRNFQLPIVFDRLYTRTVCHKSPMFLKQTKHGTQLCDLFFRKHPSHTHAHSRMSTTFLPCRCASTHTYTNTHARTHAYSTCSQRSQISVGSSIGSTRMPDDGGASLTRRVNI